jgi:hypothetical protein
LKLNEKMDLHNERLKLDLRSKHQIQLDGEISELRFSTPKSDSNTDGFKTIFFIETKDDMKDF